MATPTPATLEEFKEFLNKTGGDAGSDPELTLHLEAATEAVENWRAIGPLVVRTFTERAEVDCGVMTLRKTPVDSVTSATRVSDGLTYATADLDVSNVSGIVTAVSGRLSSGTYDVVYEAGRDPVPTSLILATLVIGGHMWKTQRGPRSRNFPRQGSTEGGDAGFRPGAGYLIPNQAATLMQPYTSVLVG